MGVSVRLSGGILLFVLALVPQTVAAAPIEVNIVDPLATTALNGTFTFDNDVALFHFFLEPGTFTFTAGTTSAETDFDPILALFDGDGNAVTYTDEFGGVVPAIAFGDIDANFAFPLLTLAGNATYTLAVTQFGLVNGNFPHESLADGFDMDADGFSCFTFLEPDPNDPLSRPEGCTAGAGGMFDGQSGAFSLDLAIVPEGGGGGEVPVPEPGTLSLVALGTAAAALSRRRRARHHTNTQ